MTAARPFFVHGARNTPYPRSCNPDMSGAGSVRASQRAYPRSRGATRLARVFPQHKEGLSPLARGNRISNVLASKLTGPIPARAGQPMAGFQRCGYLRAYPRSRGATTVVMDVKAWQLGLSPLARGNRLRQHWSGQCNGPIPARAGQPIPVSLSDIPGGAYPRSRGATGVIFDRAPVDMGLSPLARGNPERRGLSARQPGPIPARAGQPCLAKKRACRWWAYPRSRGATWCSPAARPIR